MGHVSEHGVRLTFRRAEISPPKVLDANGYRTPGIRLINPLFTKPDVTFRFHFKKSIGSSLWAVQQNSEHSNVIQASSVKSNTSGAHQFCDNENTSLRSKRVRGVETISDNNSSYRPEFSEGSRSPVVETPEPESRVCSLQVICQAMHPLTRMTYPLSPSAPSLHLVRRHPFPIRSNAS